MNLPRDFVSAADIVHPIVWRLGACIKTGQVLRLVIIGHYT